MTDESAFYRLNEIRPKYRIAETVDGEFMILIHGVQWGPVRDKSGAGNATFRTRQEARLKLATFYMDDRREAKRS